jgi:hypothetical protein
MQGITRTSQLSFRAPIQRIRASTSRTFQHYAPLRNSDSKSLGKSEDEEKIQAIRARAWYVDAPPPQNATPETPRQPRFTTFDPLRTLPTPSTQAVIPPLPSDTPAHLLPLHEYLTTTDLFVPESITFRRTAKSAASRTFHDPSPLPSGSSSYAGSWAARMAKGSAGHGKRRRGQTDSGEGIFVEGKDVGANWDWVVVAQVAARGKGAVSFKSGVI